ncbi:DoxX family protein [Novosphingobium profundi]|uniref:DoxX family protein n=1 Tax=Novosphingobium profundi TaxID=1774954 RepID=UPI001BDB14B5|nr:DoxX family protein [Novosphingobium profundi]MBT0667996.1 DoxX family protein [Novosphingobium profundi]
MSKIAAIIGRFLLALVFIVSGGMKFADVAGTGAIMQAAGMPGNLAVPAATIELLAGLCLAAGFLVRLVSLVLIVFTALTILFFHHRIDQAVEVAEALKNLALIGGLFLAFAHSQMWGSYAALSRSSREAHAAHRAEVERYEAEVQAAREEARAQALAEGRPAETGAFMPEARVSTMPIGATHRRWFDW